MVTTHLSIPFAFNDAQGCASVTTTTGVYEQVNMGMVTNTTADLSIKHNGFIVSYTVFCLNNRMILSLKTL